MLHRLALLTLLLVASKANAITLTSGQSDYTTTADITTTDANSAGAGINSTQAGTSSSPRKIKNTFTISTSGSGADGIRVTKNYNQITNDSGATISIGGSGAHGIDISGDFSSADNLGSISTLGSSGYAIYISSGSDAAADASNYSTATNSGSITTATAHGIYAVDPYTRATNSGIISISGDSTDYGIITEGDNSVITNSGTISAPKYAIYNSGSNSVINNSGTLSGGVRIGAGTLNISGGTISGEIEGNDAGTVNVSNDFTQSANFSNLVALNITSGTLTANNTIEATNISVSSGANLKLNSGSSLIGTLSGDGTLNIVSGASLTPSSNLSIGTLLIDGTLNLSGTNNLTLSGDLSGSGTGIINLGTNDQTVAGNFSLSAGDTLKVTGNQNGFGSLTVIGSATIDSAAKLTVSASNKYLTKGQTITLISAGNGSSLENISDITINSCQSSKCGILKLSTEVSGNDLLLNVDYQNSNQLAVNDNSKKIYNKLTDISESSGKARDFLDYLSDQNLSDSELEKTLTQLAPESSKARSIGSINVVGNSLKTSEMRLDKIRAGTENLPARGTSFAQILSPNKPLDVFNLQSQGGALANGFWAQPFGGSAVQQSTSEDIGYKTILSGVTFGVDHNFSPQTTSGAAFSLARSETKSSDSLKKTSALTYQLNFYNSQNFERFFIDSLFGIAASQYTSSRAIPAVSATASANYTGFSYAAKTRLGLIKRVNRHLDFIPEISLAFMQSNTGKYSEKGADSLNLNVNSVNSRLLEGRVGGALSWSKKARGSSEFRKFVTIIKSSLGYNLINDSDNVISSFSGQNSTFNSQVSPIDPASLRAGAELNAYHIDDTIFGIDYQFERRLTYYSHFISLKVRQEF